MKKILSVLFILCISAQVFAKITPKEIVGKWKFTVETDQGEMKGVFNFTEKDGKLAGEIVTDEGYNFEFDKVEIKGENTLYFTLTPEYDTIEVTLKINGKKFKGTGSGGNGEAPITGEKIE